MTTSTTDVCYPQIARIDESNKLRRLNVEQCIRPNGICRTRPRLSFFGMNMGFLFARCIGISTMTVGATKDHIRAAMHVSHSDMASNAAMAFERSLLGRLIGQIDAEQFRRRRNKIFRFDQRQGKHPVSSRLIFRNIFLRRYSAKHSRQHA